jgi:hypothetical protein
VTSDPNGLMVNLSLYKPCPFWVLREGESRGGAGTMLTDYEFTNQQNKSYIKLELFGSLLAILYFGTNNLK